MDDVERVARLLCNAEEPRVLADKVDAPDFDNSAAAQGGEQNRTALDRESIRSALNSIDGTLRLEVLLPFSEVRTSCRGNFFRLVRSRLDSNQQPSV